MTIRINVETEQPCQMLDITSRVAWAVAQQDVQRGVCMVFCPHTTAGLTINENADPDVVNDMLMALQHMVPADLPYRHGEGNSTAHVKASLVGSSVSVAIEAGQLVLGTWQGIYLCEFDRPRQRKVFVQVLRGQSQEQLD